MGTLEGIGRSLEVLLAVGGNRVRSGDSSSLKPTLRLVGTPPVQKQVGDEGLELLARWLTRFGVPHRVVLVDDEYVALLVDDRGQQVVIPDDEHGPWVDHVLATASMCQFDVVRVGVKEQDPSESIAAYSLSKRVHAAVAVELATHARACVQGFDDMAERFIPNSAVLDDSTVDAAQALSHLLQEGRRILVLGDFGSGKSTHLRRIARTVAESYLDGARVPAPLFLSLEDCPLDVDSILQTNGILFDVEMFEFLLRCGVVLPLLDGLDEMTGLASAEDSLRAMARATQPAPTVISSRPGIFPVRARLLGAHAEVMDDLIELLLFTPEQRDAYIDQALPDTAARAQVHSFFNDPEVAELARRPVFLELIVRYRKWLASSGSAVTVTSLYSQAAEDWLTSRAGIAPDKLRAFAQTAAWTLWHTNRSELSINEAAALALMAFGGDATSLDAVTRQTRSAVLEWNADRTGLIFGHRSFLEYCLANHISTQLLAGQLGSLAIRRLSREARQMVVALDSWASVCARLQEVLRNPYQAHVSENALLLLASARVAAPDGAQLNGAMLAGETLDGQTMRRADLRGATLTGSSLRGCSLQGAQLSDAQAGDTVFDGADLGDAQLHRIDLSRSRLHDAKLDGTALDGARLQEASFDRASLRGASLRGAHLRSARGTQAVLVGADFRDSDLSMTQWLDCNWRDARFNGAVATGALWIPDGLGTPRVMPSVSFSIKAPAGSGQRFVHSVRWSPDGNYLATSGPGIEVWVWEVATGRRCARIQGHKGTVWSIAWSHDSTRIISASSDGTARVWDVSSGAETSNPPLRMRRVSRVAWSPTKNLCAAPIATANGQAVLIWEPTSDTRIRELATGGAPFWPYAWSRDERFAIGREGSVAIWDLAVAGGPLAILVDARTTWSLAWTDDNRLLAGFLSSNEVLIWDQEGQLVQTIPMTPTLSADVPRSQKGGPSVDVSWHPRRHLFAACNGGRNVGIWRSTGELVATIETDGVVCSVAWSRDGGRLATTGEDSVVRVWVIPQSNEDRLPSPPRCTAVLDCASDTPIASTATGFIALTDPADHAHFAVVSPTKPDLAEIGAHAAFETFFHRPYLVGRALAGEVVQRSPVDELRSRGWCPGEPWDGEPVVLSDPDEILGETQ